MGKVKRIVVFFLIITLCFLFKKNVYAVTASGLDITRLNYSEGDIKLSESDEFFKTPMGMPIQLYAVIDYHSGDLYVPGVVTGTIVEKADLQGVTWSSSNTSVATVDSNGLVTPVSTGTTNITATLNPEYLDDYRVNLDELALTETRTITIIPACDNQDIESPEGLYTIYYSDIPNRLSAKTEVIGYLDARGGGVADYSFPIITNKKKVFDYDKDGWSYFLFDGWYSDKSFNANKKVTNATDLDYIYIIDANNSDDNRCSCSALSIVYAKWKPENVNETEVEARVDNSDVETVAVEDTALNSSLYILAVSILLLIFGILIVIISLNDKSIKMQ